MSNLTVTISEQGTKPYDVLTLTGDSGAWIVIKKKSGVEVYSLTWVLRVYLYVGGKYRKLMRKT